MDADLKVGLGLDPKEFDKGVKEATSKIEKFGEQMTGLGKKLSIGLTGSLTVAATAAFALAKSVGNTADRLLDLADITGATTDIIQEYQYVANQAGVASEAFTNASSGLIRRLNQVDEEGSRVNKVFEQLGVSVKDSAGEIRNGGEIMDELIMSLAGMDNQLKRNSIGNQVFGRSWEDIAPILGNGADGIARLKQEANDLGLVLSNETLQKSNEFRAAWDKTTATLKGVSNQLGSELAPLLLDTFLPLIENKLIPALRNVVDRIGEWITKFNNLSPVMKNWVLGVTAAAAAIGPLLLGLGAIIKIAPLVGSAWVAITGPIGVAVIAIGAAVAGIVYYWDYIIMRTQRALNELGQLADGWTKVLKGAGLGFLTKEMEGYGSALSGLASSLDKKTDTATEYSKKLSTQLALNAEISRFAAINAAILSGENETLCGSFNEVAKQAEKARLKMSEVDKVITALNGKEFNPGSGTPETIGSMDRGSTLFIPDAQIGEIIDQARAVALDAADEFNEYFNDNLGRMIGDGLGNIASGIGNAIVSGGNIVEAFGKGVLDSFGTFLSEFGDKLIAYGIASEAFSALQIAMLNPFTAIPAAGLAIAAGVALKIAGSAARAAASGSSVGGQGSQSSTFTSGTVVGESQFRENKPELFLRGGDIYIANENYKAKLGY